MEQKTEYSVAVLDKDGKLLNNCRPARARMLLESKKALLISKQPLKIRLVSELPEAAKNAP